MWKHTIKQFYVVPKDNLYRTYKTIVPRVRFAPSPTGYLHLGGLRTALYNYLFTKSRNGVFILRIEDTDQTRKVEGSVEALVKDLEWAGIHYDEGPGRGDCGSYIQSERLNIYQEYIQKLIDNRSAYKCFCTERRLNILRRDAIRHQKVPKYDNKCRSLSDTDIKRKLELELHIALDLRWVPDIPLANVVDDYLMGVTHVLRGVEWQISTTKHLLIYRAFGWKPPEFGHLPLIVNSDGTKLSKRQSDVKVEDYRDKGIYPLALVNYITLSGGGFEHVVGEGVRLRTMEQLTKEFQINKITSHPSRLNPDLLNECNRLEIKRQLHDDKLKQTLINKLQIIIKNKFPNENLNMEKEHIKTVLEWATSRISKVEDLATPKFAFLWILPSNNVTINKYLFEKLINNLEKLDKFEQDSIKNNLKEFSLQNDIKFPVLMKLLRSVLSGLHEGPSVAEMMQLFG